AIDDQGFEDIQPARALAAYTKPPVPEPVKLQHIPQVQSQPAATPLARRGKNQAIELHMHRRTRKPLRRRAIIREQRQALRSPALMLHRLDRPHPPGLLSIINLAKVQKLTLHHPATSHAAI